MTDLSYPEHQRDRELRDGVEGARARGDLQGGDGVPDLAALPVPCGGLRLATESFVVVIVVLLSVLSEHMCGSPRLSSGLHG